MQATKIEWTDTTWNCVTGCSKVSQGCKNCYAEAITNRFTNHYPNGFKVTLRPEKLTGEPWMNPKAKPRRIFVNSMSDLFHEDVPPSFIAQVIDVAATYPQHQFQILTKRAARMKAVMAELLGAGQDPLPNVWLGVSVEDHRVLERISYLQETPAAVRFISFEPIIGDLGLIRQTKVTEGRQATINCTVEGGSGIHWAIFGGESGPGSRPLDLAWVREGLNWCQAFGIAPFVKQLGSVWAKANGCPDRKGGDPAYWPEDLRVREFPSG